MPVDDAKYHMKRCVDSGLWVPNAADAALDGDETAAKDDEAATEAASTEKDTKKSDESPKKKSEESPAKEEPIYAGVSTEDVDWSLFNLMPCLHYKFYFILIPYPLTILCNREAFTSFSSVCI